MRNACGTALRYVLFFSNLIIWIGGLVAIGITTWILINNASIRNFLGSNLLSSAVYILLITGVVASLVALFGCIGAIKEIKFILVIYFILLFIIFTVMLAGGILGYIFIETVENTMETEMYNTLKLYNRDAATTNDWDYVQSNIPGFCLFFFFSHGWEVRSPYARERRYWDRFPFARKVTEAKDVSELSIASWDVMSSVICAIYLLFHCCGVNSQRDWLKLGNIPESCRIKSTTHPFLNSEYHRLGCLNATITYVQKHSALIGGSGITIACLMLLGMLFSWTLYMIIE